MRRVGWIVLCAVAAAAAFAPVIAPHGVDDKRPDLLNEPPTLVRVRDGEGRLHLPFVYRWRLVDRLEQRYELDPTRRVTLSWFSGGRLVQSPDDAGTPLMLLGADSFGR